MILGIDLVFSIINLMILAAIALVGFIYFARPAIKQEIHNELAHVAHLKSERMRLIDKQELLKQKMLDQNVRFMHIKEKVSLWREKYHKEQLKIAETSQKIAIELEKKIEKQSENYNVMRMQQKIAPEVYHTLTSDLEKYFSDMGHVEKYFKNVFHNLELDQTKSNS